MTEPIQSHGGVLAMGPVSRLPENKGAPVITFSAALLTEDKKLFQKSGRYDF